jgi:hypothetical protein
MTARAALHTLLSDDVELATIGVERVYPTNAVDTAPESCFVIVRWDPSTVAFKTTGPDRAQIWVHDVDRSYDRINAALHRIRELLTDTVHRAGADGWTLTTAEWLGEGPDLFDAGYSTCTRYADFTVISRYTAS